MNSRTAERGPCVQPIPCNLVRTGMYPNGFIERGRACHPPLVNFLGTQICLGNKELACRLKWTLACSRSRADYRCVVDMSVDIIKMAFASFSNLTGMVL